MDVHLDILLTRMEDVPLVKQDTTLQNLDLLFVLLVLQECPLILGLQLVILPQLEVLSLLQILLVLLVLLKYELFQFKFYLLLYFGYFVK